MLANQALITINKKKNDIRRYSSTVVATCLGSVEQVSVELFLVLLFVPTLSLAAIALPIAGSILLFVHTVVKKKKITILQSAWKEVLIISVIFAAIEFTWYDAVNHIGAAKTALINIPLETIVVLFFAFIFLRERLHRVQWAGAGVVAFGIVLAVGSDFSSNNSTNVQFGIGEVEIIGASVLAAIQMVMVTRLLNKYSDDDLQITAFILLFSGIMLNVVWFFNPLPEFNMYMFIYPLVPAFMFLSQFVSMKKVGASITSIVTPCSMILILAIQMFLVHQSVPVTLPENLTLALSGGVVSIIGIGVIFATTTKDKQ